jgi:hypothetical protein
MKKVLITIIAVLAFVGCERPSVKVEEKETEVQSVVLTNTLKTVNAEFKKISKEDQELFHKQVAGAALFLKNVKTIKNTKDFDPILSRVQKDFGWTREKYPDFVTAIEAYLREQNYQIAKDLVTETDREWFHNIFYSLESAIKYE